MLRRKQEDQTESLLGFSFPFKDKNLSVLFCISVRLVCRTPNSFMVGSVWQISMATTGSLFNSAMASIGVKFSQEQ